MGANLLKNHINALLFLEHFENLIFTNYCTGKNIFFALYFKMKNLNTYFSFYYYPTR